ncbi:hypothetical protein ElyMa_000880800 [Elysia marginata]|uniref:DUF6729 domain-containing protein n=1 Tax=Elysia marginata TaxID=1093978 RepID=A0AAV4H5M4_9GAST|nr:hypothetical protein ElyMa_000880800 [Elysia marginata]
MSKSYSIVQKPQWRRQNDGHLTLSASSQVERVGHANESAPKRAQDPAVVRQEAIARLPVDLRVNDLAILGATTLEFGMYYGQTFLWALEHATGWVVGVVAQIAAETEVDSPIGRNKKLLANYALSFPEVKDEIDYKTKDRMANERVHQSGDVCFTLVGFGKFRALSWKELSTSSKTKHVLYCEYIRKKEAVERTSRMGKLQSYLRESNSGTRFLHAISRSTPATSTEMLTSLEDIGVQGPPPTRSSRRAAKESAKDTTSGDNVSEEVLLQLTQEAEQAATRQEGSASVAEADLIVPPVIPESPATKVPLRKEWFKTLPPEDHIWLSKTIFQESGKLKSQLQMWYHPPQIPLVFSQPPASPNLFFHHRFFLWMPYRMWNARFLCSQPGCEGQQLNSCGLYRTVRRVIDRVDDYYMGTEYLECGKCHKKSPAWNQAILRQLDPAQRLMFPAVLSYKLALDSSIVDEMRDRALGNTPTMLQRKLQEAHYKKYVATVIRYQVTLGKFAAQFVGRTVSAAKAPPPYRPVPTARWLLDVYVSDVHSRLDELKAKVTSTFGTILKMDSTKRVLKKLAGDAAGTAAWSTNIGNEHGQVLMSVLPTSEAKELWNMADGLMKHYESAGMPESLLLYVDWDCCGKFHI